MILITEKISTPVIAAAAACPAVLFILTMPHRVSEQESGGKMTCIQCLQIVLEDIDSD